nr:transcription factor MYB1R1-like [Ipomoea batatas]
MAALCRSQCVSSLRTCGESAANDSAVDGGAGGSGEIMLFGVRVKVDPMRKSVSLNNLSQSSMDGGRAQTVPIGVAEGGEGRLERNLEKLCEDSNPYTSGKSCSEILSPAEQPQPPPPPI